MKKDGDDNSICNLRIIRTVIYRILQLLHIQWDAHGSQSRVREQNSYIERVSKNEESGDKLSSGLTIHCQKQRTKFQLVKENTSQ